MGVCPGYGLPLNVGPTPNAVDRPLLALGACLALLEEADAVDVVVVVVVAVAVLVMGIWKLIFGRLHRESVFGAIKKFGRQISANLRQKVGSAQGLFGTVEARRHDLNFGIDK